MEEISTISGTEVKSGKLVSVCMCVYECVYAV